MRSPFVPGQQRFAQPSNVQGACQMLLVQLICTYHAAWR